MPYRPRVYYSTIEEALFSRVEKGEGCWEWQGVKDCDGYGVFTFKGQSHRAHRVALELKLGRFLREGYQACHICDNPGCCRGDHLFEGTQQDNSLDASRKGRTAKGERNGAYIHRDRVARGVRQWRKDKPERIAKGERAHRAKLNEPAARLVRQLYREGFKQILLAEIFGISQASVSAIVLGKSWKHILPNK